MRLNEMFRRFAAAASFGMGSAWAFLAALLTVVAWLVAGPAFAFSDHWQLLINTGTTILTFLMVFLIQNTQNRDAKAINLKLDELLRAAEGARTGMVNVAALSDEQLRALEQELMRLGEREGLPPVLARRRAADRAANEAAPSLTESIERPPSSA
jgi:low affinity Fe/Cu permease